MDPDLIALLEAMAQRMDHLEAQLAERDARDAQLRGALAQQDAVLTNLIGHVEGLYERLNYLNAGPAKSVTAKELDRFLDRAGQQTALNCGSDQPKAPSSLPPPAPVSPAGSFAELLAKRSAQ